MSFQDTVNKIHEKAELHNFIASCHHECDQTTNPICAICPYHELCVKARTMMEKARNTTVEEWNEAYHGWMESDEDRTLYEQFNNLPPVANLNNVIDELLGQVDGIVEQHKGFGVKMGDTDCLENIADPEDYITVANSENPEDYHNTVPTPPPSNVIDGKDSNFIKMINSGYEHDDE